VPSTIPHAPEPEPGNAQPAPEDAPERLAATWTPGAATFDVAAAYIESLLPAEPGQPDSRAAVARALLHRFAPVDSLLTDEAAWLLSEDHGSDRTALAALEADPRYLIGRLQQALTALLAADIPAHDAVEQLMYDAIGDAVTYRQDRFTGCPCGTPSCDRRWPDYLLAVRYESLVRELGLLGPDPATPVGRAALHAARRGGGAAETAARITAAAAVRADFERESHAYAAEGGQRPDWATWSQRLSLALAGILDALAPRR
jgi:hypothetical protein